ncbi:LLM class flavin-dependent oxidoreductase [Nonomuraea sp. NPDC049158]|uniref:LLM class flavin-dependent oxidoreductase n=1 Tax=Nonomuraea sp. NPDC049158 TaxID=3155649 RepID=UPI003406032E
MALRPAAWAAKQIASLQHLSGGRVLLGVGSGGSVHGDAAWRAVGISYAERAQRTDATLEILPSLVEGKPTNVNGEVITLSPSARTAARSPRSSAGPTSKLPAPPRRR